MGWWPTNTFYTGVPCPECGLKLARGFRRFGPAQVRCGNCDATIITGFHRWPVKERPFDTRTRKQKVGQNLWKLWMLWNEMLLPSRVGMKFWGNQLSILVVMFNLALWMTIVWPVWLLWRFVGLVRECRAYEKTSIPPVWFPVENVSPDRVAYRRSPPAHNGRQGGVEEARGTAREPKDHVQA